MKKEGILYLHDRDDLQEDVWAYFPFDMADFNGNHTCYQHVGQHGAASPGYAAECAEAKPDEYEALHNELVAIYSDDSIGDSVEIVVLNGIPEDEWEELLEGETV